MIIVMKAFNLPIPLGLPISFLSPLVAVSKDCLVVTVVNSMDEVIRSKKEKIRKREVGVPPSRKEISLAFAASLPLCLVPFPYAENVRVFVLIIHRNWGNRVGSLEGPGHVVSSCCFE
jgi:hypothetical protein